MCRGKQICTELGPDPTTWDSRCPLRLPAAYMSAITDFEQAVHALLSDNDMTECLRLISGINSPEITGWYIEHGQMSGWHRARGLGSDPLHTLPLSLRDSTRSPIKLQEAVFERDGYRCRYCGNRLVSQHFLRAFIARVNSPAFQRGRTNLTTHAIIHLAWPVADHVVPWSIGGSTSLCNLVSSCGSCNYGKDGYSVEQIGINDPRNREPIRDGWRGFSDMTVMN